MTRDERRLTVTDDRGIAVAAVAVGSLVTVALSAVILVASGGGVLFALSVILIGFPVAFFPAVLAFGFIALPLTHLLARCCWERAWVYPVAGAITGVGVAALLFGGFEGPNLLLLGAAGGGSSGVVWWRYYRRHLQKIGD